MTRKVTFFEGWSWFKFNNLGQTHAMNLKFYTSVAKGLKLKVRKFWGLIPAFVEVTEGKLVAGAFLTPSHPRPEQSKTLMQNTEKWTNISQDF